MWYLARSNDAEGMPATIAALAARNKVDETMLLEALQRLSADPQVELLRSLYESDESDAFGLEYRFADLEPVLVEHSEPPSRVVAPPEDADGTDAHSAGPDKTDTRRGSCTQTARGAARHIADTPRARTHARSHRR